MSHIILEPESFLDKSEFFNTKYLSQYCESITNYKIIFNGFIDGSFYSNLIFPNIVKANYITTDNIVQQFPDLIEAGSITYVVQDIPDIGNLKSAVNFYMDINNVSHFKRLAFVRKYVNFIDENTLVVNGKKISVKNEWMFGRSINDSNYEQYNL